MSSAAVLGQVEVLAVQGSRRFAQYGATQPLQLGWLDRIPKHWQLKRLKFLSALQTGLTLGKRYEATEKLVSRPYMRVANVQQGFLDLGEITTVELPASDVARYELRPGDVLMTEGGDFDKLGRGHIWEGQIEGCLHQNHIFAVRPNPHLLNSRFLSMLLSSSHGRNYFTSTSQQTTNLATTNCTKLQSLPVPLPPLAEQEAIAAFLDRETTRIDELIAKKRQLLDLLQEKRAAVISHAVTGSQRGMEVRLRHFSELLPGFAFPSQGFSHDADDVRLLRGINIRPGCLDWEDTVYWPREDAQTYSEYELRPGDIVLGMDRPWISSGMRVARIAADDVPSLLLQRVARLRAAKHLSQDYLELLLSSRQFTGYFAPILTGVSVPHISPEQIGDFRFVLPPPNEQSRICGEARNAICKIDVANQTIRCAIEELVEYRTALISAAVTGKIDVRGAV